MKLKLTKPDTGRPADARHRWPGYLLNGRVRTSTVALIVVFAGVWWVYDTYQAELPPPAAPQVVPPGFIPDPAYTWVPRTRLQQPPVTVTETVTPTPTTTEMIEPTPPPASEPESPAPVPGFPFCPPLCPPPPPVPPEHPEQSPPPNQPPVPPNAGQPPAQPNQMTPAAPPGPVTSHPAVP